MATFTPGKNVFWKVGTGWTDSSGTTVSTGTTFSSGTVSGAVKFDGSKSTDTAFAFTAASAGATLLGGAGADSFSAATSANGAAWFNGGSNNDTLTGGKGVDTFELSGAFGVDTLKNVGSTTADVIKVGTTFSNLSFAGFSGATLSMSVTGPGDAYVNFAAATSATKDRVKFITSDKTFLASFASVTTTFTSGSSTGAEYVREFGSNAGTFTGYGKNDTLVGGSGNDSFAYNKDIAVINGGSGDSDTVYLAASAITNTKFTIDLTSSMFTSVEVANVTNNTGDTVLRGLTTSDKLLGGNGADSIWSRGGNDIMTGGAKSDTFWFVAGDGVDTITDISATADKDTVKFVGINQAGVSFNFTSGSLLLTYGTSGSDIVDLQHASGKTFTVQTDDKTFNVLAGSNNYSGVVGATGTVGADYIRNFFTDDTTNTNVATFDGKGGADTLIGGSGKDSFVYDAALAYVDGGAGIDTLGTSSLSAVTIDLYANASQFANIEVVAGGSGNDVLRGYNGASETLVGGAGNNSLWSAGGNDSMQGGTGADTYWFAAGDGNDSLGASTGTDKDVYKFYGVNFAGLTFAKDVDTASTLKVTYGSDTVTMQTYNTLASMKAQTFQTSDATFHLITDQAGTDLSGTSSSDLVKMFGDTAATIDAKGGADTIYGGGGDDTITYYADLASVDGGLGTNKLIGGTGTYSPLTLDLTLAKYTNIQQVDGGSGNDVIRGTAGAQTLSGGAGNDALWGGAGDDSLIGGAGVDTYWFTAGDGTDTIAAGNGTENASDVVKFYSVASTANVTAAIDGSDLNLTLADGSKLVLQSWSGTSKVNKFTFDSGTYKLSDDAATWTKL